MTQVSRNFGSWPNEFMFEITNIVMCNILTLADLPYLMSFN